MIPFYSVHSGLLGQHETFYVLFSSSFLLYGMFFLCWLKLINNELGMDSLTAIKVVQVNNSHCCCILYAITSMACLVLDVDCCVLGCDTMCHDS